MIKTLSKSTAQNHKKTTTTKIKPSSTKSALKGKIGEDKACAWLESNGFVILERNFHTRFGEIDIIALEVQNTNNSNAFQACKNLECEDLDYEDLKRKNLGCNELERNNLWHKEESKILDSQKDFTFDTLKSTLHFIEVKSYARAEPAYAITQKKLSKIYQSIEAYFLDISHTIHSSQKETKSSPKTNTTSSIKSSSKLCTALKNINLDSLPYCVSAILIKENKISFLPNVSQNT